MESLVSIETPELIDGEPTFALVWGGIGGGEQTLEPVLPGPAWATKVIANTVSRARARGGPHD